MAQKWVRVVWCGCRKAVALDTAFDMKAQFWDQLRPKIQAIRDTQTK